MRILKLTLPQCTKWLTPLLCKISGFEIWIVGFFLHKKRSTKRMLEGLRLFLLRDYLHFKWWIMVFTSFRIDERFLILFVHIFVSPGSLWNPLERPKSLAISKRRKRLRVKNYLHNFSLWAFFFFSIWLGSLVFLRGLQREPGETKICTKRSRNLSSIRKLVKTIIHHLKCK